MGNEYYAKEEVDERELLLKSKIIELLERVIHLQNSLRTCQEYAADLDEECRKLRLHQCPKTVLAS